MSVGVGAIGVLAGAGLMLITGLLVTFAAWAGGQAVLQFAAALTRYLPGWRVEYLGLPGVGSWPSAC